jgi:hypothetical protein
MATQGDAAFDALQAEIKAKYAEILAKKQWLDTTGQTYVNATWPFSPIFRNWAGTILRHIRIVVDRLEKFTDAEYNLPPTSERDAKTWALIQTKAEELKTLFATLRQDGSDVLTRGSNAAPEQPLGGRGYPNRIPTYGWDSTAGVNYRSQIQFQENAADFCVTLAIRAGGFIRTAGVDFRFVLQAILNLIRTILGSILTLTLAMISAMIALRAPNPVTWSITAGLAGAAVLSLSDIYGARTNYFTAQEALIADAEPAATALAGFISRTSAFRPDNTWPDPTKDVEFPHMVRDSNGQWSLQTLPQLRGPQPCTTAAERAASALVMSYRDVRRGPDRRSRGLTARAPSR